MLLVYGQQPALPTSIQPGRHSTVLSTRGLSHTNLGASNFQTHHAHHSSHLRVFLKTGQEEKFTEESLGTLHFLPDLHCSQGESFCGCCKEEEIQMIWKGAEKNNPESCKHLEAQCFALQF